MVMGGGFITADGSGTGGGGLTVCGTGGGGLTVSADGASAAPMAFGAGGSGKTGGGGLTVSSASRARAAAASVVDS